ncbi:MAG: hypothetical protein JXA41_05855 [Deltaproteobacteria bacterium]|nr:hypothetical protein [Deltaproteobacteria bacterium]
MADEYLYTNQCVHGSKPPCSCACPFNLDIRTFIKKVKSGNFGEIGVRSCFLPKRQKARPDPNLRTRTLHKLLVNCMLNIKLDNPSLRTIAARWADPGAGKLFITTSNR